MMKYRCAETKSVTSSDENFHVSLKSCAVRRAQGPTYFSAYREQPERREVVIFMLVNKPEHSIQNKESSLNEEDDFLQFSCQIDG